MGVAREPHDRAQAASSHDERTEEADAMVTRSVAGDKDHRTNDDPDDGADAPA